MNVLYHTLTCLYIQTLSELKCMFCSVLFIKRGEIQLQFSVLNSETRHSDLYHLSFKSVGQTPRMHRLTFVFAAPIFNS